MQGSCHRHELGRPGSSILSRARSRRWPQLCERSKTDRTSVPLAGRYLNRSDRSRIEFGMWPRPDGGRERGDPGMDRVLHGAIAGLAGTAVMSAAMAADRILGGIRGEVPPRKVGKNLERAVGVWDELSQPAFEASWIVAHFAYGTAAGAAYEL